MALRNAKAVCGVLTALVLLLLPCALLIVGTRMPVSSDDLPLVSILMGLALFEFAIGLALGMMFALWPELPHRLWPPLRDQGAEAGYSSVCTLIATMFSMLPMMGFISTVTSNSLVPYLASLGLWAPAVLWTWPRPSQLARWWPNQVPAAE